ncbi:MAG: hypothetical protein KDA75_06220 [Planctomycetaceae bacterium]|nr:hypothetical protein [Planctomycetaceae bacterium]
MQAYRYKFAADVEMSEVSASLLLATWTTESLHGEARVRLDSSHAFDAAKRSCVIDAETDVGRDLNRVFVGLLRREFGEMSFRVERLTKLPEPAPC